jgi:hypothetical protein
MKGRKLHAAPRLSPRKAVFSSKEGYSKQILVQQFQDSITSKEGHSKQTQVQQFQDSTTSKEGYSRQIQRFTADQSKTTNTSSTIPINHNNIKF